MSRGRSACARWARLSSCPPPTRASVRRQSGVDFGNDGMAQLARSIALFEATRRPAQVALARMPTDTCLPELLRECRKAADDLGCLLTTHFAQTPQELPSARATTWPCGVRA